MGARLRYDRVEFDRASIREAADGSLVIRGRFARTGLQTYHNDDGSERVEYRSDAEVRASAPTFEGKGLTDLHPRRMVSPDNWRDVGRGHLQGVTYVAAKSDGDEGWLEGDFHVKSRDLIDAIKRGDRSELSAGYYADEDPTPGNYRGQPYHARQTGIVANHVAVLPSGTARAGRGARLLLDSNGNQLPPGDRRDGLTMERQMDEFEVVLGGVTFKVKADATARQALTAHLAQAQGLQAAVDTQRSRADSEAARVATLTTERDAAKGRADAASAEVADLKAKLADATDQKRIDARVRARADLVEKARRLGGPDVDVEGTDLEIKVRALDAFGVRLDDEQRKSSAYVDARVDAALERLVELEDSGELTVHDALDYVTHSQRSNRADPLRAVWDARDRMLARAEEGGSK
jgi:hypothetical protein